MPDIQSYKMTMSTDQLHSHALSCPLSLSAEAISANLGAEVVTVNNLVSCALFIPTNNVFVYIHLKCSPEI